MKLYGIANCDTVKKARAWLTAHAHQVAFHDFRKQGVDAAWLREIAAQTGWQALLNTRGTTWRRLPGSKFLAAFQPYGNVRIAAQASFFHISIADIQVA